MKKIAYIISVVFHPIFIPVYLFLLLAEVEPVMSLFFTDSLKWRFVISLLITTVLGPAMSMYVMKRRGVVDDLEMKDIKGRSLIFIVTALYYVFTYIMLKDIEMPRVMNGLFIGMMVTLILLAILSLKYKISAHMAAVGGAMGLLLWVFSNYGIWQMSWFLSLILLAAIIGSSRLLLQAHSLDEVGTGFILGGLSVFSCLALMV